MHSFFLGTSRDPIIYVLAYVLEEDGILHHLRDPFEFLFIYIRKEGFCGVVFLWSSVSLSCLQCRETQTEEEVLSLIRGSVLCLLVLSRFLNLCLQMRGTWECLYCYCSLRGGEKQNSPPMYIGGEFGNI